MDTLSHAAWGYVTMARRPRVLVWAGALAGAAPDLLWFVPLKIEQTFDRGWVGLLEGRNPRIWRASGPAMPADLVESYFRYYVWTHSLVVLALVVGMLWLLLPRWRRWLWLAAPYGLHIVMDIPTHERFLTRPFHPLSAWAFRGVSWADPRIFWPHLAILLVALIWAWRARTRKPGTSVVS